MRFVALASLALAGLVSIVALGSSRAEDLKSGPQPGEFLGPFEVTKAAGAKDDGVDVGKELCYRCQMGNRPVVMVFARKADAHLANLVKELDKVVGDHKTEKMASFVNLLGTDPDSLKSEAKSFVEKNKIQNVAFVVPSDHDNGPEAYKIDPKAEITVLIYKQGKVEANHALEPGKLTEDQVKTIVADTGKILK